MRAMVFKILYYTPASVSSLSFLISVSIIRNILDLYFFFSYEVRVRSSFPIPSLILSSFPYLSPAPFFPFFFLFLPPSFAIIIIFLSFSPLIVPIIHLLPSSSSPHFHLFPPLPLSSPTITREITTREKKTLTIEEELSPS